jgi:hypothetical protein
MVVLRSTRVGGSLPKTPHVGATVVRGCGNWKSSIPTTGYCEYSVVATNKAPELGLVQRLLEPGFVR